MSFWDKCCQPQKETAIEAVTPDPPEPFVPSKRRRPIPPAATDNLDLRSVKMVKECWHGQSFEWLWIRAHLFSHQLCAVCQQGRSATVGQTSTLKRPSRYLLCALIVTDSRFTPKLPDGLKDSAD
eukprot:3140896-Rhodomonas_salina.3